jgi:YD repeat-containing protein
MKLTTMIAALAVIASAAVAEPLPQTRLYDARGNAVGVVVPQGDGSTRYYDARGNSLGTSTTTGGTTTFYGPGGNVTGRTVGPAPVFPGGGRR